MRYAIISDIHANRPALAAVLDDIDKQKVDICICLGDIIGYGPSPVEVLDLIYHSVDVCILGNHDAVACKRFSSAYFNDLAREIIRWSRNSLRAHDLEFFIEQRYVIESDHFAAAHSNFVHPENFSYVLDHEDAFLNFKFTSHKLMFIGHTHVAGAYKYSKNGSIEWLDAKENFHIKLKRSKRYLVNVGAVGVSRDTDQRASYCIFDTAKSSIYYRFVEYDLHTFIDDVRKCGNHDIIRYFSQLIRYI